MEINLNLLNVVPSLLSFHIMLVVNKSKIINIVKRCISISTYTIRLANQLDNLKTISLKLDQADSKRLSSIRGLNTR